MGRRNEQGSGTAAAAAALGLITAVLGVATAVLGLVPSLHSGAADPTTAASVFLSRDSGPGGTRVEVSGEGYGPGESVVLYFHTEQIGRTTADPDARFSNVSVVVPRSFSWAAPHQFDVVATGRAGTRSASAPFTLSG